MTVGELCELFDGTWSELPVRFFVGGEEISIEGGPELKSDPHDGTPDHYEFYLAKKDAP